MLGYEQLSGTEKVRRAVRAAWFEMPQAWVDTLRQMPSEVKLTHSSDLWVLAREMLYTQALEQGLNEHDALRSAAKRLIENDIPAEITGYLDAVRDAFIIEYIQKML
jgi:hypothetical protein